MYDCMICHIYQRRMLPQMVLFLLVRCLMTWLACEWVLIVYVYIVPVDDDIQATERWNRGDCNLDWTMQNGIAVACPTDEQLNQAGEHSAADW